MDFVPLKAHKRVIFMAEPAELCFPMRVDNLAKALVPRTAAGDQFAEVQWRVVVFQTQALVKAD